MIYFAPPFLSDDGITNNQIETLRRNIQFEIESISKSLSRLKFENDCLDKLELKINKKIQSFMEGEF